MIDKISELANLIKKDYHYSSLINSDKRILVPKEYSNLDESKKFLQLGLNLKIPNWIFTESADNSLIGSDYADALERGEIMELLKSIDKTKKDKESDILKEVSYTELNRICLHTHKPTDLFMPLELFIKLYQLYPLDKIKRDDQGQTYLKVGSNKVRLHWSNKYLPFKKIYLLDSSGIRWTQKRVKDMSSYEDLKSISNPDDLVYIAYKELKGERKVKFLIRVVYRIDILDKNKMHIIRVPKH